MANGSDEIKTYGAIRCKTAEGKAAFAQQIFDEQQSRFQSAINEDVNDLLSEVFPLVVSIVSSNAGDYEVGSPSVGAVTPSMELSIIRKGADVAASAVVTPSSGNVGSDNKTITDSEVYSTSKTINVSVSQGGQTRQVSARWRFLNYVYGGELNEEPLSTNAIKQQLESWGSSHGELTNKTDSTAISANGTITLHANKYYLFAVAGSVNFVVRHAETGALISGIGSGKNLTVSRVNGSGTDSYSWVVIPKASSDWSFIITNS